MRDLRFKVMPHWSGTFDVVRSDGALLGADLDLEEAGRLADRLNEEWDEEQVEEHEYHDDPHHHPQCPLCERSLR